MGLRPLAESGGERLADPGGPPPVAAATPRPPVAETPPRSELALAGSRWRSRPGSTVWNSGVAAARILDRDGPADGRLGPIAMLGDSAIHLSEDLRFERIEKCIEDFRFTVLHTRPGPEPSLIRSPLTCPGATQCGAQRVPCCGHTGHWPVWGLSIEILTLPASIQAFSTNL